ncbi:tyrosine-type recombinase/integrase [Rossellomorea marisflavi]
MDGKTMGKFQALFEATPPNIKGLVFFSPHNARKVLTNENANKILRGLLKELNIDQITIHGLRHTHASVLLYRKVSIY